MLKIESRSVTNANAGELLAAGRAVIESGELVLDLSAVAEVDSAAVALLLDWQRQAKAAGARLQLVGVPADIASLARLYGVDSLLDLQTAAG
jgi:phospholipid transport system transporter-binding protein